VNHKSKNTHHSSTSVVQLDGTLLELGLLVELVPSKVNESVAEVTDELTLAGNILHDEKLQESNEEKDLKTSVLGDGIGAEESSESVGVAIERVSGGINVSGKVDTGTGDDVTEESKLADASVLDLNVTETIEACLASLVEESKGIEESERGLGTKLRLEGVKGGGGLSGLRRGKSGGRSHKGGEGSKLHHGGYWNSRWMR